MEEQMAQAPAEEMVDPMDGLMSILGELQETYGIAQEDMDAVVDAINMVLDGGAEPEAPAEEPAPEGV